MSASPVFDTSGHAIVRISTPSLLASKVPRLQTVYWIHQGSIGRFIPPSTVVVLEIDQEFYIVFDNAHIFARFGQAKDHAVDSNFRKCA